MEECKVRFNRFKQYIRDNIRQEHIEYYQLLAVMSLEGFLESLKDQDLSKIEAETPIIADLIQEYDAEFTNKARIYMEYFSKVSKIIYGFNDQQVEERG